MSVNSMSAFRLAALCLAAVTQLGCSTQGQRDFQAQIDAVPMPTTEAD